MSRKPRLGSVSTGTLRSEDLLRVFADELETLDTDRRHANLVTESRTISPESDDAQELITDLEQALGEYAPPYCYFGTHPGDGADFGYWPDWEAIDVDRRDGTLRSGDDLPVNGSRVRQYLHISDHGNAELYTWDSKARRWQSEWGVV